MRSGCFKILRHVVHSFVLLVLGFMIIMFISFLADCDLFAQYMEGNHLMSDRKCITILLGLYITIFTGVCILVGFQLFVDKKQHDHEKLVSIEVRRINRTFETRPDRAFPNARLSLDLSDDVPVYDAYDLPEYDAACRTNATFDASPPKYSA